MLKTIKETVVGPLSTRLGTLLAGVLAPYGVHADFANMVAIGVIGTGLVACDLVLAQLRKRKIVETAFVAGVVSNGK